MQSEGLSVLLCIPWILRFARGFTYFMQLSSHRWMGYRALFPALGVQNTLGSRINRLYRMLLHLLFEAAIA